MRRITLVICLSLLFSFISGLKPALSYAATLSVSINPSPIYANSEGDLIITISSDTPNTFISRADYGFGIWNKTYQHTLSTTSNKDLVFVDDKTITAKISLVGGRRNTGEWTYKLWAGKGTQALDSSSPIVQGTYYIYPPQQGNIGLPQLQVQSPVQQFSKMPLVITNVLPNEAYTIFFDGQKDTIYMGKLQDEDGASIINSGNPYSVSVPINVGATQNNKVICLRQGRPFGILGLNCDYFSKPFDVIPLPPSISPTTLTSGQAGVPNPSIPPEEQIPNVPHPCAKWESGKCVAVSTGLGIDISTDPQGFVKSIFTLVLGLSGGIALILIMISGIKFMTSGGNPEATKAAGEQLTSAIIGLLFIIFSFVILQIIGVDILRIPGFQP